MFCLIFIWLSKPQTLIQLRTSFITTIEKIVFIYMYLSKFKDLRISKLKLKKFILELVVPRIQKSIDLSLLSVLLYIILGKELSGADLWFSKLQKKLSSYSYEVRLILLQVTTLVAFDWNKHCWKEKYKNVSVVQSNQKLAEIRAFCRDSLLLPQLL